MSKHAQDITRMMGYDSCEQALDAVGAGELILVKVPETARQSLTRWLREQANTVTDTELASIIHDIVKSVNMASELERYPEDVDVCDMNLPDGWPSYCDKDLVEKG